jgi:hypothetical protein
MKIELKRARTFLNIVIKTWKSLTMCFQELSLIANAGDALLLSDTNQIEIKKGEKAEILVFDLVP